MTQEALSRYSDICACTDAVHTKCEAREESTLAFTAQNGGGVGRTVRFSPFSCVSERVLHKAFFVVVEFEAATCERGPRV